MPRQIDMSRIGRAQPVVKKVIRPLVKVFWDIKVEGVENIPEHGGALLCPNHVSVIDSFFVPAVLERALIYVGKAEYLDDWKTRRLFPALGMIPIDRRGGEHAASALEAAKSILNHDGLFGIYPEGTRSRSGKLHKGHTGAARLAVETGKPIIPVGLVGTREIQPPDQSLPTPFKSATVRFGRPIDVSRYADRVGDRGVYRQITDELMFEIQALCGLEYVHVYAGAKAEEAELVEVSEPTIERKSSADVLKPKPLVGV
ncbi:MAG: 1-acyl-sn-glycerol-3-phosphate acyltransferase [Acidimicrobiales bacterium]|nr:1-acyl-sn-glycerol-3-phosphate acyltransferase [Acidimicrobiales bacterium]